MKLRAQRPRAEQGQMGVPTQVSSHFGYAQSGGDPECTRVTLTP